MKDGYDRYVTLLNQSQHFPAARLKALQMRGLNRFLQHARDQVPAYRRRLSPLFESSVDLDFSRWEEVPVLTRTDVQRESRDLRAASVPPQSGATQTQHTSGSTGTPLIHHRSQLQHAANQAVLDRLYNWHNIDGNKGLAVLATAYKDPAPYPHGSAANQWRHGYEDGQSFQLDIMTATTEQQLEWLCRQDVSYLTTAPNNARALIETAAESGQALPPLQTIMLSGEVLEAETRELIAQAFGCTVINLYGASESGRLATTCPEHDGLHLHEEISFVEVVDEHGRALPAGQTGRILTTSFYNFAMPLIRYALGDFGAISEAPCPCGRSSRTLKFVAGRQRNLFRFIDGTTKWPDMKMKDLRSIYPFRQMQVVQDQIDHLTVHMVESIAGGEIDHSALQAVFRKSLHPSLSITIQLCDEISRTPGGKFEDFVSKI